MWRNFFPRPKLLYVFVRGVEYLTLGGIFPPLFFPLSTLQYLTVWRNFLGGIFQRLLVDKIKAMQQYSAQNKAKRPRNETIDIATGAVGMFR